MNNDAEAQWIHQFATVARLDLKYILFRNKGNETTTTPPVIATSFLF